MNGTPPRLIGLQLFPYDVADEGADAVVSRAILSGANTLLPAVAYIPESHPVPGGILPHNPRHKRYVTDGGMYFAFDEGLYPDGLVPPRSEESINAPAALDDLLAEAGRREMQVVPWIDVLNGHAALIAPDRCVVNACGDLVPGWLCPNQRGVLSFVGALVTDVIRETNPPAVFIDRIRYPEWGPHGCADLATCFCARCAEVAADAGIDLNSCRSAILGLIEALESDPAAAAYEIGEQARSAVGTAEQISRHINLLRWIELRHAAIDRVVASAKEAADQAGVELWLDVWPPTYGWLLGQDLARLSRHANWIKPFTYHKLAGGADIAGMLHSLSADDATLQTLYRTYLNFFGFVGPDRFGEFVQEGLDPAFITQETRKALRLARRRSKIAAGLQLWQVGPAGVREAVTRAVAAQPHGAVLYCYGWATLDELAAAGEALSRVRPDQWSV